MHTKEMTKEKVTKGKRGWASHLSLGFPCAPTATMQIAIPAIFFFGLFILAY